MSNATSRQRAAGAVRQVRNKAPLGLNPEWSPFAPSELDDIRYYLSLDRTAVSTSLARRLMATVDVLIASQGCNRRTR